MEIDQHNGTKSKKDKITVVNGHVVTFEELAWMCISCIKSRKSQGIDFNFIGFLNECFNKGQVSDSLCKKFQPNQEEKDVVIVAVSLYNNEEEIYPRSDGFRGGGMLRDFLNDCIVAGTVSEDILQYYQLNSIHL